MTAAARRYSLKIWKGFGTDNDAQTNLIVIPPKLLLIWLSPT
jgi:hypothetical protein